MAWFGRKPEDEKGDATEHRKAERVPIFEVTEIFRPGEHKKVTVKDISLSGIRFSVPVPLAPQTVLKVRIDYNPIDFPLRALVVWSRQVSEGEYDHGAEFVNVPKDELNLLADHLEALKAALADVQSRLHPD